MPDRNSAFPPDLVSSPAVQRSRMGQAMPDESMLTPKAQYLSDARLTAVPGTQKHWAWQLLLDDATPTVQPRSSFLACEPVTSPESADIAHVRMDGNTRESEFAFVAEPAPEPVSDQKLFRWLISYFNRTGIDRPKRHIVYAAVRQAIAAEKNAVSPTHRQASNSFIERANRLDVSGRTDAALDLLYDSVDEFLCRGELAKLNSYLSCVVAADLTINILIGLLTATLPARSRLPARRALFMEVDAELRRRNEFEEGLLTGLEA